MTHDFPYHPNPGHHHRKLQFLHERPPRFLKLLTIIEGSRTMNDMFSQFPRQHETLKQKIIWKEVIAFYF